MFVECDTRNKTVCVLKKLSSVGSNHLWLAGLVGCFVFFQGKTFSVGFVDQLFQVASN